MGDFHAVACLLQALGNIFGDHDRSVLAAGAAEGNCQITFAFMDIVRKQINQEIRDSLDEFGGLGKRANIFRNLGMESGERPKFGNEVRVGQKAHIENQVGVFRNSVLESEAHERNQYFPGLLLFLEQLDDVGAEFVHVELRSVDDQVGDGTYALQVTSLGAQGSFYRAVSAERVRAAGFAIAAEEDLVLRLRGRSFWSAIIRLTDFTIEG